MLKSWLVLLVIVGVVALPFVTQNEIYQTLQTAPDGVAHTQILEAYREGENPATLYPAQAIFGDILANVAVWLNVPSQSVFNVFMGVLLVGALWTNYWVVSKLAGYHAGILVVLLGLFRINSLLALFTYAVAFELLDLFIVFPLLVYCVVKWLAERKKRYFALTLVLTALFSYLHVVAIYVPYIIVAVLVVIAIMGAVTGDVKSVYVLTALAIFAVNLAVSIPFNHQIPTLNNDIPAMVGQTDWQAFKTHFYYLTMIDLTPLVIGIGITAIVVLVGYRIKLSEAQKYLVFIMAVASLVIMGAGMIGSSLAPDRQIRDGAILLSILFAVAMGIVWQRKIAWAIMPMTVVTGLNVINTGAAWIK